MSEEEEAAAEAEAGTKEEAKKMSGSATRSLPPAGYSDCRDCRDCRDCGGLVGLAELAAPTGGVGIVGVAYRPIKASHYGR